MLGVGPLHSFDAAVFHSLNGLVGRSWALDSAIALALDNIVVKAGVIGACFLYAWYRDGGRPQDVRRRILLVTLLSLFLIAPLTKTLSDSRLAPRPFLLGAQAYTLQQGELAPVPRDEVRVLQTGQTRTRIEAFRAGEVDPNDLGTFPSDHAAFFVALALGILLASRSAGLIALGWAIFVTLLPRIAVGMHSATDISAGAAIGAIVLGALQAVLAGRRARWADPVLAWTARHPGLTAAALFLLLLEAADTMQTLKRGLELAGGLVGHLL
jgi:membrane-associated phospholipid phosphatase